MIAWLEKRYKKSNMTVWDIALIKWSVLFWTLFLVALWPPLASLDWYWYLVLGVVFMIRPVMKLFR